MHRRAVTPMDNTITMDRKQAAAYLGIGMNMLYSLTKKPDNPIPSAKIGRRVLYRKADIDAWLEKQIKF